MSNNYFVRVTSACACLSMLCGGAAAAVLNTASGSCSDIHRDLLMECNNNFNDDHPDNVDYMNEAAWAACRQGADAFRAACYANADLDALEVLWGNFLDDLEDCIDDFGEDSDNPAANPENLQACIEGALNTLRELIEDLNGSQNACQSSAIPVSVTGGVLAGDMAALRSAAVQLGNANGKYPAAVNTTVSVTAGVNANPGNSYDVGSMQCIRQALAIAIYQTNTGTKVMPMDADTDTTDGTDLDIIMFESELVHASTMTVVTIFFDDFERPMLSEIGQFEIEDSAVTGDWNRDGIADFFDVSAFLDGYNAQTARSDMNDDGVHDQLDVDLFVAEFNSGP